MYLTQGPEGYRVVAHDQNFARAMEIYKDVVRDYRNTLRELAK